MSKWFIVVFAVGMAAFAAWRLMSAPVTPTVSKTEPVPPGATPVVSEAQYRKPSATEIINLRSKCAEVGQTILEENSWFGKAANAVQNVISKYDVKTNRCYVQITATPLGLTDPNAKERWQTYELYDGQNKELLAQAVFNSKGSTGNVFDPQHLNNTYSSAMMYMGSKMNEDRETAQAQ